MSKKMKLYLKDIEVQSFVTSLESRENKIIKGGRTEGGFPPECEEIKDSVIDPCDSYPGDECDTIETLMHTVCINGDPAPTC